MKPHSIATVTLGSTKTPAQRKEELLEQGGWAARHGMYWPKGTVLPETQVQACPRVKVADLPEGLIPPKYYERNLEQNQALPSCCRHPEDHEIEAKKSHPDEKAPDIYIFHCTCGKKHVRFLVGKTDDVPRPIWDAS